MHGSQRDAAASRQGVGAVETSPSRSKRDPISRVERLGFHYAEAIKDDPSWVLCRAFDTTCGETVLLKMLAEEVPAREARLLLQNEYRIVGHVNEHTSAAAKPLRFVERDAECAMVLADSGEQCLEAVMAQAEVTIADRLEVAIVIARAVRDIHDCGVIHRDLRPANIVVAAGAPPGGFRVRVIDFALSALESDHGEAGKPNLALGDLAYLPPEQLGCGRLELSRRSDLYSLGVMFYELFCGVPPFDATEPAQLSHCHIAEAPIALATRVPDLPQPISHIVGKLLCKSPEDRYQSASGLLFDLVRLEQAGLSSPPFALGERDISERFAIPDKLYGREREVGRLLSLFGEAREGKSRVAMVYGYSGVGKTALVHEIVPHVRAQGSYVVSGKFDQHKGDIPYDCFVQAFRSLIRRVLAEPQEIIEAWRDRIAGAVSVNGRIITDVIPELELIVGPQPEVVELAPEEANNRFVGVLREFLRVFIASEHPFVMILDDLQWADKASLDLIHWLIADAESESFLVICVYRSNEVPADHPLTATLDRIRSLDSPIHDFDLVDLRRAEVSQLLADMLHLPASRLLPLIDLCLDKTAGNPFFLGQLLRTLHRDGAIRFDRGAGSWAYDILEIHHREISTNVVDLMVRKIKELPAETRRTLEMAACIGRTFELELLAACCGKPPDETLGDLWSALKERLIEPADSAHQELHTARAQIGSSYRFIHDRVQQAADSLVTANERAALHLLIARQMIASYPPKKRDERIFEIVEQFTLGLTLVNDLADRQAVAEHYLAAGRRATRSAAHQSAQRFFETGLGLLTEAEGPSVKPLITLFIVGLAETAHVLADFTRAKHLIERGLEVADTPTQRARLMSLRVQEHFALNRPEEAIAEGIRAMGELGLRLSPKAINAQIAYYLLRVRSFLKSVSLKDLDGIEDVRDERLIAASSLSSIMGIAARVSRPELLVLVVLRNILMFKDHGVFPETAFALAAYGMVLTGPLGNEEEGERVATMAEHLSHRAICAKKRAHTRFLVGSLVRAWRVHISKTLDELLVVQGLLEDVGDFEYATSAGHAYGIYSFCAGSPLGELSESFHDIARDIEAKGQQEHLYYLRMYQLVVRSLMEDGADLRTASRGICDYDQIIKTWNETGTEHGLFTLNLARLLVHFYNRRYDAALRAADEAQGLLLSVLGMMTITVHNLYDSLSRLAWLREQGPALSPGRRLALLAKVARNQTKMKHWAKRAPMNFAHKHALVEAEWCRQRGNNEAAMRHYTAAIAGAETNGFVQEAALANELAGTFYLQLGQQHVGGSYLAEAARRYRAWGALFRVRQLEAAYPAYCSKRSVDTRAEPLATAGPEPSDHDRMPQLVFDVDRLIRASDAFAGEVELDRLLHKVLAALTEIAGAQRVALLLEQSGDWRVAASSRAPSGTAGEDDRDWPASVIRYVGRTGKVAMTGDDEWDALFGGDAYLRDVQPRSVICFPLVSQGTTEGVVYMENRLTKGVFDVGVLATLRMLSVQAASAIEKARLYETLEQQKSELAEMVSEKSREVDAVTAELDLHSKLYTVDDETAEAIHVRLSALMQEEKVYRDSALTLQALSARAGYPPRSVSEVINACFGKNFYTFLNDYRIEEVKLRLADPLETDSVLNLAGDAGFASKSSFNTFFKKSTGMTPTAYRKSRAKADS